jgi:mono/diheme cytochrome c family protein
VMRLSLLVVCAALGLAASGHAQSYCAAPVRLAAPYAGQAGYAAGHHAAKAYHAPHHTPYHADPAFFPIAVFTPVPLFTVTAPAGHHHGVPVAQAPAAAPGEMQQVLQALTQTNATLKDLDARLRKLEAGQDEPVPLKAPDKRESRVPAPGPADPKAALAVLGSRCASCHEKKEAQAKGGGLALFEGGRLLALSAEARQAMMDEIAEGNMPKAGGGRKPLDQAELDLVLPFLRSLR